jgi:hypothetical protein
MKTYIISFSAKKNNDIKFFNIVKNQEELIFDKKGILNVAELEKSISEHLQKNSGMIHDVCVISISLVPTLDKEISIEDVLESKIGEFKKTLKELRDTVYNRKNDPLYGK